MGGGLRLASEAGGVWEWMGGCSPWVACYPHRREMGQKKTSVPTRWRLRHDPQLQGSRKLQGEPYEWPEFMFQKEGDERASYKET